MSNAQHVFAESVTVDAGRHYARLRHALDLVDGIAGRVRAGGNGALDESARVSGAYGAAAPVTQRRFDTLVAEVSAWTSAGLDALASAEDPRRQPRAAAAALAVELEGSLGAMKRLLRL